MNIDPVTLQVLPTLEIMKQNIILYLPRLISAILILIIGFKSQPFFINWINRLFEKVEYDESLEKFLISLFNISFKILIILTSVSIAGIETASILAILGAAGFAVGLALQGSMSNFASGILILALKPIKVNEFIKVSSITGTVNKIDIFNTLLLTPDNKMVIIPNSNITNEVLVNYSRKGIRRLDIKIGIDYKSNITKVKKVLTKAVEKNNELVISNESKNTSIGVFELAESAIIMSVFVWCYSKDYLTLKQSLLETIKIDFDKAKIKIPFPTVTITK